MFFLLGVDLYFRGVMRMWEGVIRIVSKFFLIKFAAFDTYVTRSRVTLPVDVWDTCYGLITIIFEEFLKENLVLRVMAEDWWTIPEA